MRRPAARATRVAGSGPRYGFVPMTIGVDSIGP